MESMGVLSRYTLGGLDLRNRVVMAPMTRSRAIGNIPNDIMAEYYGQRAAAGLIITEGTSPSPNGLGYCRIPGLFSTWQVDGWKKTTDAVHAKGGAIFVQLMHTGRISHPANMPPGAVILAPSAVRPAGQMWTDAHGLQEFPVPTAMMSEDIRNAKREYIAAAVGAMKAHMDGVELHGANGYLLEEFLSPHSNIRTDMYGGSIENRCRFLIEVAQGVADAIGKDKLGIRLSPYGNASDMAPYPEIEDTYKYLAGQCDRLKVLYLHIVDHSSMGAPTVPIGIKKLIREKFHGTLILTGGYTESSAEAELQAGLADLIGFGRPYLCNPDLVERFTNGWPVTTEFDMKTFYTPGAKGYTDYPVHTDEIQEMV